MYVMHSADETKDRWHASAWKTMYFIVAATDAASSKASAGVAPSAAGENKPAFGLEVSPVVLATSGKLGGVRSL